VARRHNRFVGLVVALAACGDVTVKPDAAVTPDAGPDLNEGATSGTRLKLRYDDYGDVRVLEGVFDTQRMENCTPQLWSGGKGYCVPPSGGVAYANATCTQKLGQVFRDPVCTTQLPPPAYFTENQFVNACELEPAHMYMRGTKVAATQYYYKLSDGTCGGPVNTTSYDFYALGAEVPMSDLAETPLSAPGTTGRLGQRFYESADGLRFPLSYRVHDALLGVDCYPEYTAAGATTGRCVPENAAFAGDFRDSTCSQPVVTISASCTTSKFAAAYSDCPYDEETYYTLGAQFTPAMLYYDTGTACQAFTPSTSDNYYNVGAQITLATLARQQGPGGRLKPIYFSTAEGLRARDNILFDTQLQSECFTTTQPDGSISCMPHAYTITTYYTDMGCTQALDLMSVYRGATTCSPPPLPSYAYKAVKDAASCKTSYDLHSVGAAYTGPRFRKSGASCTADTGTSSLFYRIAGAIPTSDLVSGHLVTEP